MPLILRRKPEQEIITNGAVRIRVVRIKGNSVTLACTADKLTTIMRAEVLTKGKSDALDENKPA